MDGVREFLVLHWPWRPSARTPLSTGATPRPAPYRTRWPSGSRSGRVQLPDSESIYPTTTAFPRTRYMCILLGMGGIDLAPSPALALSDGPPRAGSSSSSGEDREPGQGAAEGLRLLHPPGLTAPDGKDSLPWTSSICGLPDPHAVTVLGVVALIAYAGRWPRGWCASRWSSGRWPWACSPVPPRSRWWAGQAFDTMLPEPVLHLVGLVAEAGLVFYLVGLAHGLRAGPSGPERAARRHSTLGALLAPLSPASCSSGGSSSPTTRPPAGTRRCRRSP